MDGFDEAIYGVVDEVGDAALLVDAGPEVTAPVIEVDGAVIIAVVGGGVVGKDCLDQLPTGVVAHLGTVAEGIN